jgi:hypothetical protein
LFDAKGAVLDALTLDGAPEQSGSILSEELESIARRNAVMSLAPTGKVTTNIEMRCVPVEIDKASNTVSKLLTGSMAEGQDTSSLNSFAIQVRLVKAGDAASAFNACPVLLNVNPHPNNQPPVGKAKVKRVAQLWPEVDPASGKAVSEAQFRTLTVDAGWRFLGLDGKLVLGDKPAEVEAFFVDSDTDGVGPELFKIFATEQDVNFASLLDPLTSRGGQAPETSLGNALRSFAKMQPRTRGGSNGQTDVNRWCTASITLNVIRPKS